MTDLHGRRTKLRPATINDVAVLVTIRSTPEVETRWRGTNIEDEVREAIDDEDLHLLVIEDLHETVVGAIQWAENDDPEYPHAGIDLFVDPSRHDKDWVPMRFRSCADTSLMIEGFIAS